MGAGGAAEGARVPQPGHAATAAPAPVPPHHVRAAVIGAGFGGLGAGIRLRQAGVTDFVILERAQRLGGTWRDNAYPGCACDVPSHLYSFSFAPNPDWSRTNSEQAEVWDDGERRSQLTTDAGEHVCRVLIVACGPLSEPSIPDLPGLDSFGGTVFHS